MISTRAMMSLACVVTAGGIAVFGHCNGEESLTVTEVAHREATGTLEAPIEATAIDAVLDEVGPDQMATATEFDATEAARRWHAYGAGLTSAPLAVAPAPRPAARRDRSAAPTRRTPYLSRSRGQRSSMIERSRRFKQLRRIRRDKARNNRTLYSRSRIRQGAPAYQLGRNRLSSVFERSRMFRRSGSKSTDIKKRFNKRLRGVGRRR